MVTLYGYTIFVGLGLLAIVIAVFVFAVSIYKAASELSTKEEEEFLNRRKELIKSRKEELVEIISGVEDERLTRELGRELDKLNAELGTIDRSILMSRDKAKALTVRNMVSIPASFLLVSITASGIAIATSGVLQTVTGIISWVSIATGLYFIYKNLSALEFFSRVIDLSTLMEQALERHAEKRRPIVDLDIPEHQLIIKHGDTQEIGPFAFLKQGLTAKNIKVRFVATKELNFPKEKLKKLGVHKENMRDPRFFFSKVGDLNYNVLRECPIKVKAPDKPGNYPVSYWIMCDEFTSEEKAFIIRVI